MDKREEINEHAEMYLIGCVKEVDEKFCQYVHEKIHELPPSIHTRETAIYFYVELTRVIFERTINFIQVASNLTKSDAKELLTDACHGKFNQ